MAATPLCATLSSEISQCELCCLIDNGHLSDVTKLIHRQSEKFDSDKMAVYRTVKFYQKFLSSHPEREHMSLCDLWRSPKIAQSETRLQLLEVLRLLLKCGLDSNVATGVETPLMAAVRTHDESLTRLLLDHGADPNFSDGHEEMNAFALSIILNDISLVELMLMYGAKVNKACCGNMTALQLSMNKCVQISKTLLQNGADIQQVLNIASANEVQITGPPLIQAVQRKNVYLASVLLEHSEDVNQAYGANMDSPLHMAIKQGNLEMVQVLIQYGANLDKSSGQGHTPLGLSLINVDEQSNKIARLLLASGCSRFKKTIIALFQRVYSPIFMACFMGNTEIVKLLIQENQNPPSETNINFEKVKCQGQSAVGANRSTDIDSVGAVEDVAAQPVHQSMLNFVASDGSTPLFMATFGGHFTLVKYLLQLGADPKVICCHGNLVHAAVLSSSTIDLLKLTLDLGCNVDLVNEYGNTPLLLSARINRSDICEYLVSRGAYLNVKDRFGETALSASVYFGCEENSRILTQHGADPDLADSSGTTALYWSIFTCRERTLKLLLSAGACFTPQQLGKYPRNLKIMKNAELLAFVRNHIYQPKPMHHLCKHVVRKTLACANGGRSVMDGVLSLPIPSKVKDSLMFKDFV